MTLQHIDALDWVTRDPSQLVAYLDGGDCIHHQLREQDTIAPDEFAIHTGLGGIDQDFFVTVIDVMCQIAVDVLDGLTSSQFVAADDGSWMHLDLDQLVGPSE